MAHRLKKPLVSDYKGLLTASYQTPLKKWQFDLTSQFNGGGRMPTPDASNYKQPNPIIDASNPRGDNFDGSMVWGPVHGRKIYAGIRFNISRD